VVLSGKHADRAAAVKDMAGIAFHVMMETGIMVEALPLWDDELENPEIFANPGLIKNISRDGIFVRLRLSPPPCICARRNRPYPARFYC